jgi:hypothetical protein
MRESASRITRGIAGAYSDKREPQNYPDQRNRVVMELE